MVSGRPFRRRLSRRLAGCELGGEVAHQHLIGVRVDVDLFAGQREREIGGVGRKFAAHLFGGGGDFLLGGLNYFSQLVFRGFLDPDFFAFRFFFRGGLHSADLDVHLAQAVFNVRQSG